MSAWFEVVAAVPAATGSVGMPTPTDCAVPESLFEQKAAEDAERNSRGCASRVRRKAEGGTSAGGRWAETVDDNLKLKGGPGRKAEG
jgi:hypothetical protein